MADLEHDLRARAPARLAAVLNAPAGERMSRGPWADEALFADDLHLGTQGATLLSTELGRRLALLPALTPPL